MEWDMPFITQNAGYHQWWPVGAARNRCCWPYAEGDTGRGRDYLTGGAAACAAWLQEQIKSMGAAENCLKSLCTAFFSCSLGSVSLLSIWRTYVPS